MRHLYRDFQILPLTFPISKLEHFKLVKEEISNLNILLMEHMNVLSYSKSSKSSKDSILIIKSCVL